LGVAQQLAFTFVAVDRGMNEKGIGLCLIGAKWGQPETAVNERLVWLIVADEFDDLNGF
jgi:hypothetical protein